MEVLLQPYHVAPRSLTITITLVPSTEKEVNFNLICHVHKKMERLMLNVKGEGYSMECLVMCEDAKGKSIELVSNGYNEINFGQVCSYQSHSQ